MKSAVLVAILVAFAVPAVAAAANPPSPSRVYASPIFYTHFERLSVVYAVGWNDACDPEGESSGDMMFACGDLSRNNADWDVHVYELSPGRGPVYSDRFSALAGRGSVNLWWHLDLGVPSCYANHGRAWRFRAVVRLFSPIDDSVVARNVRTFAMRCR